MSVLVSYQDLVLLFIIYFFPSVASFLRTTGWLFFDEGLLHKSTTLFPCVFADADEDDEDDEEQHLWTRNDDEKSLNGCRTDRSKKKNYFLFWERNGGGFLPGKWTIKSLCFNFWVSTHTHAHARTRTHTHTHAHARTHTHKCGTDSLEQLVVILFYISFVV